MDQPSRGYLDTRALFLNKHISRHQYVTGTFFLNVMTQVTCTNKQKQFKVSNLNWSNPNSFLNFDNYRQ